MFSVTVQSADFDVAAETKALTIANTQIGAVASFIGLVRGSEDSVRSMELEHYPGMTERALEAILAQAQTRWPLDAARIVHRFGRLEPGEQIVLVLTASRHREAALEACAFIMDYLKTQAPFWKKEDGPEGARWVDARESDESATDRWSD
ncbi:MAG: molybdenum cofactor biosynthesis protein MoaE [Pseudomonadota bacterium]